MSASSPREAVAAFREHLQRALLRVANSVVKAYRYKLDGDLNAVFVDQGDPVSLYGGSGLALVVRMEYRVLKAPGTTRGWQVRVAAYHFGLDGPDGREILVYQWRPHGEGRVRTPHLHFGAGVHLTYERLRKAHLPTGYITLPQFLWLAVRELEVHPLRGDWRGVFRRTHRALVAECPFDIPDYSATEHDEMPPA